MTVIYVYLHILYFALYQIGKMSPFFYKLITRNRDWQQWISLFGHHKRYYQGYVANRGYRSFGPPYNDTYLVFWSHFNLIIWIWIFKLVENVTSKTTNGPCSHWRLYVLLKPYSIVFLSTYSCYFCFINFQSCTYAWKIQ